MWGVELADPATGRWAGELAQRVQARALRHGLIVELGGRHDCVVRMLPPLNVTADVVDTACAILIEAIDHCVSEAAGASASARTLLPSAL
jgi:diaminobutyrate-2-oxoglutarate transaminase